MKLNIPVFIKVFALLAILSVSIVGITPGGLAQDLDEAEDNSPQPAAQSDQVGPEADRVEDNIFGTRSAAEEPDLVITDTEANVPEMIEDLTGVAAAYALAIPAAEFTVDSDDRQWFFGFNSAYLYPTGASNYCGTAPVYLPHGAVVNSITSYVFDNNATASVEVDVWLYAKPLGSETSSTTMASVTTTSQSANVQALVDASIVSAVINNNTTTYHIGVCLWGTDATLRFYASRINYTK